MAGRTQWLRWLVETETPGATKSAGAAARRENLLSASAAARRENLLSASDDARRANFRIVCDRIREFHAFLAAGLPDPFNKSNGEVLVVALLTANHILAHHLSGHADRLDTLPPDVLQALRTLLDEELPTLIRQFRLAHTLIDSNIVNQVFSDGLAAINSALCRIAEVLTRTDTRHEKDAALELSRQVRNLRLKYLT